MPSPTFRRVRGALAGSRSVRVRHESGPVCLGVVAGPELLEFLRRDNPVPRSSVLLTGTGIVPPDDDTLKPGQRVEIHIPGVGTLRNPVGQPT